MFQLLVYDCQCGDIRLQRHNKEQREHVKKMEMVRLSWSLEVAVHDKMKLNPYIVHLGNSDQTLNWCKSAYK